MHFISIVNPVTITFPNSAHHFHHSECIHFLTYAGFTGKSFNCNDVVFHTCGAWLVNVGQDSSKYMQRPLAELGVGGTPTSHPTNQIFVDFLQFSKNVVKSYVHIPSRAPPFTKNPVFATGGDQSRQFSGMSDVPMYLSIWRKRCNK